MSNKRHGYSIDGGSFPYWMKKNINKCNIGGAVSEKLSEKEVAKKINNNNKFKVRLCNFINGKITSATYPYFLLSQKYNFNCDLNNEKDLNLQISNNFNDTNSLCNNATIWIYGNKYWDDTKPKLVSKAKELGLNCNTRKKNNLFVNPSSKIVQENNKIVSSEYKKNHIIIEEERKRAELEKRIAELEKKNKELQQSRKIEKKPSNEIGSGFYVSKFRHVVTNQHVVNQCNKITVGDSINTQIPADLIASDKKNDLAILQTVSMEMASTDTKSFVQKLSIQVVPVLSGGLMRSEDVVGGEQIYIAGYPLGNMVSDQMKLGDGIVSATKGMDNDVSQFIVSSDIKKGNSGGPVYDSKGNVVGVAVSRLNVNRTDTINFAIKGSTVKQFLSAHNVPTKWSNRKENIKTQELYQIASKQTVMVVCHR